MNGRIPNHVGRVKRVDVTQTQKRKTHQTAVFAEHQEEVKYFIRVVHEGD
jgi:hypothetical protein